MTPERAIEILNPDCKEKWKAYDGNDMERCNEACRVAVKALEKQVPKKRIEKPTKAFFADVRCPNCKTLVGRGRRNCKEYCKECGQAIDWSDEK